MCKRTYRKSQMDYMQFSMLLLAYKTHIWQCSHFKCIKMSDRLNCCLKDSISQYCISFLAVRTKNFISTQFVNPIKEEHHFPWEGDLEDES